MPQCRLPYEKQSVKHTQIKVLFKTKREQQFCLFKKVQTINSAVNVFRYTNLKHEKNDALLNSIYTVLFKRAH